MKDSWVSPAPAPIDEVVTSAIILSIVVGAASSRYSSPGLWLHLSVVEYTSIFRFLLPGGTVMVSLVMCKRQYYLNMMKQNSPTCYGIKVLYSGKSVTVMCV